MNKPNLATHKKEYLEALRAEGKARNTIRYYDGGLNRFLRWCKTQKLEYVEDIDRRAIRNYWLYLMDNSNGVVTAARAVRAFFNWLVEEEILDASPITAKNFPKENKETIVPLTEEEIEKLLDGAKSGRNGRRDYALVMFLFDTGLRVSEAMGVKFKDIDFDTNTVTVWRKGGKTNTVNFSYRTSRALRSYLRYSRPRNDAVDKLFLTNEGEPMNRYAARRVLKRAAVRAGVDERRVSPHKMRHSFAVAFLRNGGSALHLQQLLGHRHLEMTRRYVNFSGRDLSDAHTKFSPVANLRKHKSEDEW